MIDPESMYAVHPVGGGFQFTPKLSNVKIEYGNVRIWGTREILQMGGE